jgi:hypothetical protein
VPATKLIRSKSAKSKLPVKTVSRKKSNKENLKRAKSKSYANYGHLSQSIAPVLSKVIPLENPNTMFDKVRLPYDEMKVQTSTEIDVKLNDLVAETPSSTKKCASQTMVFNKA